MSENFNREEFYKSMTPKPTGGGCLKIFGLIGLAVSLFFLVRNFMDPMSDSGENNGLRIVMGGLLLISAALTYWGFKRFDPQKDPHLTNIKTGGQHIVWVYADNRTMNGFSSYWTTYMTKDGKKHSIATVTEDRQQEVIHGISQLYPNAAVGHNDAIEKEMKQKYG